MNCVVMESLETIDFQKVPKSCWGSGSGLQAGWGHELYLQWGQLLCLPGSLQAPSLEWGLGPSQASGWPEQHTRWAHLGAPLTGRKGVHLYPV